jgi:hypothetical protein
VKSRHIERSRSVFHGRSIFKRPFDPIVGE